MRAGERFDERWSRKKERKRERETSLPRRVLSRVFPQIAGNVMCGVEVGGREGVGATSPLFEASVTELGICAGGWLEEWLNSSDVVTVCCVFCDSALRVVGVCLCVWCVNVYVSLRSVLCAVCCVRVRCVRVCLCRGSHVFAGSTVVERGRRAACGAGNVRHGVDIGEVGDGGRDSSRNRAPI